MIDISKTEDKFVLNPAETSPAKSAAKRCIDIVVAGLLLVLLAPLMALVALLIVRRDGSGVIYAHERVGRNGESFGCLKFRTMVSDADAQLRDLLEADPAARREWDQSQKLRDDPRILKGIGHVLRATSLDELPQLWNVLMGQMSLVGPRPVVEDELQRYGPSRGLYLSVRPGLTGPWQIGARSDGTYQARVAEDTEYVRNWTLTQDIAIIVRTALIVLRGRAPGAY